MTATPELALLARETLAASGGGDLVIHRRGYVAASAAGVLLYDEDGQPMFLGEPDSPVTVAAHGGAAAVLSVQPRHACADVTAVVLAGQLAVVDSVRVDDVEVSVVALRVCSVLVENAVPGLSPARCAVPLAAYRASTPHRPAQAGVGAP